MRKPETCWAESGGVRVAYQTFGEGPRTLVGIPGFAQHLDLVWEQPDAHRFFERLGGICRVVHFDKRGTGLSDRSIPPASLDDRVRDIAAVMDAAGVGHAVVGGWSEGAALAAFFAATYPERVDGLVFSGGFASLVRTTDHPWALRRRTMERANGLVARAWGTGIVGALLYAPSKLSDPRFLRWVRRYERAAIDRHHVRAVLDMNLDIDIRPILDLIRTPTIVLHAHGDRLVPWQSGRYVADHIPGARFERLAGNDHAIWFAAQDAYLDAIAGFLTWQPQHTPDRGRVLATVLFTDIVGSTEKADRYGDMQWMDRLEIHDTIARQETVRMHGRWIKSTGDGILATFDSPAGAVEAACRIQRRVLDELDWETTAGLHTGEVELRPADIGGLAVHVAARIMDHAQPMDILASETVRHLTVGSPIDYRYRGHHDLKGIPKPIGLHSVTTSTRQPPSRG